MTTKTAEWLKYTFLRAELAEYAGELAQKNLQLVEIDLRMKSFQASVNAEKKAAAERIAMLAGHISCGFEYRMVPCEVKFNDPVDGKKTTYRTDTNDWVKTVDMDAAEIAAQKQADLPFDGTPCGSCLPRFLNNEGILVDGPNNDCKICGGSGKQPETSTAAAAGNGAELASEPAAASANGTSEAPPEAQPMSATDAEYLEVASPDGGPAIASQAEMSRAEKGRRA